MLLVIPSTLLSFFLFSFSVPTINALQPADAPVTVPLNKRLNFGSLKDLVQHDHARADFLRAKAHAILNGETLNIFSREQAAHADVTNGAISYTAQIGVGNPPTTYNLLVDTGSSNTWIGANKSYVVTSSSVATKDSVHASYGSGGFTGTEYSETVTLTPGLVIKNQSIGVAKNSSGLGANDGILGLGPTGLTKGTLNPSKNDTIPTVVDNAKAQGLISANSLGVYFEPYSSPSQGKGELTYGGADKGKFIGEMTFAPVTSTSPSNRFWGIDQTIKYDDTELQTSSGIVDTGSTLVLLASEAYLAYKSATGAVRDSATGLLTVTPAQYANLKPLDFIITGRTFSLSPNAQLWPRALNTHIGGDKDKLYLIVGNIGGPSGTGFDFINGYAFLERFYTLYDSDNQRVGFAETFYTNAQSN